MLSVLLGCSCGCVATLPFAGRWLVHQHWTVPPLHVLRASTCKASKMHVALCDPRNPCRFCSVSWRPSCTRLAARDADAGHQSVLGCTVPRAVRVYCVHVCCHKHRQRVAVWLRARSNDSRSMLCCGPRVGAVINLSCAGAVKCSLASCPLQWLRAIGSSAELRRHSLSCCI